MAAAELDATRRTIRLTTDPHPRDAVYLLELTPQTPERSGGPEAGAEPRPPLSQAIAYDLSGVAIEWRAAAGEGEPSWSGWWPEFDPQASRKLTSQSFEHEQFFAKINEPGQLTLESLILLPKGPIRLRIASNAPVEASLNGENPTSSIKGESEFAVESTGEPMDLFLTVEIERRDQPLTLRVTYGAEGETPTRTLSRERLSVPWAPPSPPAGDSTATPPPFRLAGGDRTQGETLFFGDRAKCSSCHKVDGKGGSVGPDLSGQASRKIEDIYKDIADPSASIHPDYTGYTVAVKDGRILAGVVRAEDGERIRVTDSDAKTTLVARSELEELRPSGTSIMPVGLIGAIGEQGTRDLLAYLMTPPPSSRTESPRAIESHTRPKALKK